MDNLTIHQEYVAFICLFALRHEYKIENEPNKVPVWREKRCKKKRLSWKPSIYFSFISCTKKDCNRHFCGRYIKLIMNDSMKEREKEKETNRFFCWHLKKQFAPFKLFFRISIKWDCFASKIQWIPIWYGFNSIKVPMKWIRIVSLPNRLDSSEFSLDCYFLSKPGQMVCSPDTRSSKRTKPILHGFPGNIHRFLFEEISSVSRLNDCALKSFNSFPLSMITRVRNVNQAPNDLPIWTEKSSDRTKTDNLGFADVKTVLNHSAMLNIEVAW